MVINIYILLKVLNTWVWKLIQNLVGNIMIMIFLLNWTEPMLSFSTWANMLMLRSIYFAIFDFYLSYCYLVWAQNYSTIQRIVILQKTAVRIITFQPGNSHTSHLFKQNSILKFQGKICLENILFASKSLKDLSPSVLNTRQIDMRSIQ